MPLQTAGKPQRGNPRPVYRTADGKRVPSVTTVLGVIAKPWLVAWANRLGLQGINSTEYVEEAAGAGTLTHAAIEAELTGQPMSDDLLAAFTDEEKTLGRLAWANYREWRKQHDLEPVLMEHQLVSEQLRVGGTVDLYARIDGRFAVLDFKTSARVYESHLIQLAAYRALLEEHGHPVDEVRVVLIPREAHVIDGERERVLEDTRHELAVFHAARALYEAQRVMEKVQRENREAAKKAHIAQAEAAIDWERFKR